MAPLDDPGRRLDGLPEMLTVREAAVVLRIGRTLAYQLASNYLAGQPDGLPVIRVGGCLRVPRWALAELIGHSQLVPPADVHTAVTAAVDALLDEPADPQADLPAATPRPSPPPSTPRRRPARRTVTQLSLLEPT